MSYQIPQEDSLFQNYIPVVFKWPYEADEVYVTGDWNEFKLTSDHRMTQDKSTSSGQSQASTQSSSASSNSQSTSFSQSSGSFKVTILLKPGMHRYKFYVNNSWQIDPKKPVTRGGMSNLVAVGSTPNLLLTRKIASDVASEEWDLIGWELNETWFLSTMLQVLQNCRCKLKLLRIEDMKSINGKLLVAALQGDATPQDFSRQMTIASELYASCDAGELVSLLFESMIQNGDKENLQEFIFTNIHKTYTKCSKCKYTGTMLAQTNVFMLNIVSQSKNTNIADQIAENLITEEPCPSCASGTCNVTVAFETLPRFVLLNTGHFYNTSQISPSLTLRSTTPGEKHFYDLIGCCTVVANTYHQAITRISPNKWILSVDDTTKHLPTWEVAAERISSGKATFFVFERLDVKRDSGSIGKQYSH